MSKTVQEINSEKAAKPRPDLVPTRAIAAAGRAFGYGAAKHGLGTTGRGTYRDAGTEQAEVATHRASFMRHWCAYWSGETADPESELSHLDCMMAQLSIVIDLTEAPPAAANEPPPAAACAPTRIWPLPNKAWRWHKIGGHWFIQTSDPAGFTGNAQIAARLERERNAEPPPPAAANEPPTAAAPTRIWPLPNKAWRWEWNTLTGRWRIISAVPSAPSEMAQMGRFEQERNETSRKASEPHPL